MDTLRFRCDMAEPFAAFELAAWVAGQAPGAGAVTVEVVHPDREGEGFCRWCGARVDERYVVEAGALRLA